MTPLNDTSQNIMNGVYTVIEGKDLLGDEVAGKWTKNIFCLYSNHDVIYTEVTGGLIKDSILLIGNYRVVRSGSSVSLFLEIVPNQGSKDIIDGIDPATLLISGSTFDGQEIILLKKRQLDTSAFITIGHRGGGRNAERLNISENSLEMIRYAQVLGANGIELDVKQTRDNEVIVFHDDTFSPRTVRGAYLLGSVQNFDLAHIQQFGRLIHGEKIPTLEEALNTVIDDTDLKLVWLDMKSPGIIDRSIEIQQEAINYAKSKNRDVLILLGIPSQEVLNQYNSSCLKNTTPLLIELDIELALNYPTCRVWAPKWTNGIKKSDIDRIHSQGKLVFTWTLDVREYIEDFLNSNQYDGILTDYPSLVTAMHLTK